MSEQKEDELGVAKIGETGLLELEVKDSNGSTYLHQFEPEMHLALTKAMVRSVLMRVKNKRARKAFRDTLYAIHQVQLEDLIPYESEDDA